MEVPFNIPYTTGKEVENLTEAITRSHFSAAGHFTKACEKVLCDLTQSSEVLMTSSCTHALEMSALLLDIKEGDEVIMSSFNFVSAANAFVLRGAKIVFVDINPHTMNIDENLIEAAITSKTKAILVMHYGSIPCEMDTIMAIAKKHAIYVVEDAAHCIDAYYKGTHLGSIGDFGCLSFHATKNIHCGEGGALMINNEKFISRAHLIREKGTNRNAFLQGLVDKYTWVDIGSSYLMSDLTASFLLNQLMSLEINTKKRQHIFDSYHNKLSANYSCSSSVTEHSSNGHLFYIKSERRTELMAHLKRHGIKSTFHYIPLHDAPFGKEKTIFVGEDRYTTKESLRLLRLPLYYELSDAQIDYITQAVLAFK